MDDDWDLRAVVRGYAAFTSSSCSLDCYPPSTFQPQDAHFLFCPDPLTEPTRRESIEELHDFIKPFFHKSPPLSPKIAPISRFSVIAGLPDLLPPPPSLPLPPPAPPQHRRQIKQQQKNYSVSGACTSSVSATTAHNPSPKSKRRKIQMKTVCEVPAEGLSSDPWSWRKYGQKPIKGSPYPRGYYKCSTSKGCLARKQVERNRSDPGMFIVTYTAEHNHPMPTHRNSLAGSTRQKPDTPQTTTEGDDTDKPTCSSPVSLSPVTEDKTESREDEDEEFGGSDMVISEDFFEGLEEITSSGTGDCFLEDHFQGGLPFPWLVNNATTTAAGGG